MQKHGFVDLQVNGWMGIDFSQPGLTVAMVRAVTRELIARGTLAYCPTVVTGAEAMYRENLAVLAEAMADAEIGGHLLGIHMEGPFLSPLSGARGVHQAEFMQAPDMATFQRFQAWARGRIVLLTVAPELSGVDALIQSATQQGVVVSLGHHYADRAAILRAIRAGARGATHLGNGLPQEINRHHNPLWPQLAADELTGMFITDGHHLPPDFIGVALRAKTPARFIVTSDAAPLAGLPAGSYALYGEQVEIEPSGRIICPATGYLAGSHSTQLECMNVLAALRLLSEEQLWQVGYRNPLALLGKGPQALDGLAGPQVRYADGAFHIQQAL